MSAETAPSTTPTLTAEQRLQRETMMLNGLGGEVTEDRAQAVLNYAPSEAKSETPSEIPAVQTAAEASAAKLLEKFDQAPEGPVELSEAAAIAAESQRVRSERPDPAKEFARVAAHRALDLMASEAAGRNGRDIDEAELQSRHAAIDKQYS